MNSTTRHTPQLPFRRVFAALAAALGLAACASHPVDAQWADPQMTGNPLGSARVLVVCESTEVVVSRLCVDRLNASLQERGVTVVTAPQATGPAQGQARDDARYVALARAAGATVVWAASVGPDALASDYRASSGFSIGLGGFGRSGGVGVGVGVPIGGGGGTATTRYAADARVTDVASGRLVWTAKAGSPPAGDVGSQIDNLLQRLVGAAGDAHLF